MRGESILAAAQEAAATAEMRAVLRDVGELVANGAASEEIARTVGSSFDARELVCAAICCALASASFQQAVTSAVRLGGDTDTVAAMAGAVVGARDGAARIPARWLRRSRTASATCSDSQTSSPPRLERATAHQGASAPTRPDRR